MIYWAFYICMLVGYSGVSLMSGDLKTRFIGVLLVIVNALLFWKG